MRLAIIGQSLFGAEVYQLLKSKGHDIVGVFTIPDKNNKPDPLAVAAAKDRVPVFKVDRWRVKKQLNEELFETYQNVKPELNVLAFCTQFIPMEVINFPSQHSIVYHPSLLPKHRGASAINWTLINGDDKAGLTIFWADDGLDTGPILLQKQCPVLPNDTVDSLYSRFLLPEGVNAMAEAVDLIASNRAPRIVQSEEGASYDPHISMKPELAEINWKQPALAIHNFIRGCDKVPGAWTHFGGKKVTFYGSELWDKAVPKDLTVIEDAPVFAATHASGMLLKGADEKYVNVHFVSTEDAGMTPASRYGKEDASSNIVLDLNANELSLQTAIMNSWKHILNVETINTDTDFFKSGAESLDVTRLLEEIRQACGAELQNEIVYLNPKFTQFVSAVILTMREESGGGCAEAIDLVKIKANGMEVSFPHQLYIDGKFVDSVTGKTYETVNPTDESVICCVAKAGVEDVNAAVAAAKNAFEESSWSKMSASDRGRILYRLADVLEEHKEELATIETLDSGAVYTLALKTHIGMSINTWRYFAGWCDKIEGSTIPIASARPNKNLTFTKKEPIGVCGIITPWNYPFMMLSWKMAACLAAGNTVVHKPAQVTPLTALKFAELSRLAGVPKGVINIITGSGSVIGQALSDHPDVRKIGFTGSTSVGAQIMKSCAISNIKRVSLELGGKSPLIIFSDCDMGRAIKQAMGAVFFNKGENCIAAGRLFVAESIHDEFVRRIVEETKKMVIGDPFDRSTSHGPQNHKAHLDKLLEYTAIGVKEGATLVHGGIRANRPGLYYIPAIFTDVKDDMYIAKEESFGPVMVISKFDEGNIQEVARRANATEYGLAAGVFSKDINKVLQVVDLVQGGTVFVNCYNKTDPTCPFGGFKQSGYGKDLGKEALHEYLKVKTVTIEY